MASKASSASCRERRARRRPSSTYGRSRGAVSGATDGALTAYGGVAPSRAMRTCSAISRPTRSCASLVEAPRCGVRTRFGASRSGLSAAIGSARVHVDSGAGELAGAQRIGEGAFVDDPAARHVEDEGPGLGCLQLRAPEEVPCLGRQRDVDGDDVGPMEELGQPDELRPGFGGLLLGEIRIAGDDPHLEPARPTRDRLADLPEADDPQALAPQLATRVATPLPFTGADRRIRLRDVAEEGQHDRHRVLGRGDRVARRGVDDHDARPRRRFDVDAIDSDARHADHAQPGSGGPEELRVDPRLRAHDERVPSAPFA